MGESIFRSGLKALFVAFCAILGLTLGFFFISLLLGVASGDVATSKLNTVNTQEILPNAEGKREVTSLDAPVILQINIEGVIGTENLTAKTIRQQLIESREGDFKKNRVKGILLFINTPGGTATDADAIYRSLKEYKEKYKVPIYAYVDGLCASGGVYAGMAADKIYASDASLIGSVGVIQSSFLNFSKLLEKIGVDSLTLSAGKDKDAMNPLRAWRPEEDQNFKMLIDYYYTRFVDIVAENRPLIAKDKLIEEYGARVFPAPKAKEYGYIDVSGASLSDALKDLVSAAKIEGQEYQVIRLEDKGWWKGLFSAETKNLLQGKVTHQISISPEMDLLLRGNYLYLYAP